MFEDESRDSMKAVTVSDFYLFDAHLFDLFKAVETSRYNIIAILITNRAFNLTFNTVIKVNSVQEACAKCFAVHILKFEILQTTLKNKTKSIKMLDLLMKK